MSPGRFSRFNGLHCSTGGVSSGGGQARTSGLPGTSGVSSEFGGTSGYGGVGWHDCDHHDVPGQLPLALQNPARLMMWLKGSSVEYLGDNAPVTKWFDSSGNDFFGEQVLSRRPLVITTGSERPNGHPFLRFDVNDWLYHYCIQDPSSLFAVAKAIDRARQQAIISLAEGAEQIYNFGYGRGSGAGPTRHQWWRFPDLQNVPTQCQGANTPDGTWFIQEGWQDQPDYELWINGALAQAKNSIVSLQGIGGAAAGRIGACLLNGIDGFLWEGDIAEILLFWPNAALTIAERASVNLYLAQKYDL